ncbi:hypothetical protein CLOM_g8061 [Closterium sp. NIES-68]|nr:hypothetical protein CLOM_g20792 [Closterium sp. NIES-68]GJP48780.1 hypothetical protein CLOM_g8061 [Closterium sp. NIES-68]GJP79787.1 hypothetical protein CLOP_g10005 [Closterium sp. NIES-67]GJP83516.1 hypothetical protein CLOP_g13660 [Closterium sp. NIES-67]
MARYSALSVLVIAVVLVVSVTEAVRVPDAFSILRSPADDVESSEGENAMILDGGESEILELSLESVFKVPHAVSEESSEVILDGGLEEEVAASARAAMIRSRSGWEDLVRAIEENDNQRDSADVQIAISQWLAKHPKFEVTSLFDDDSGEVFVEVDDEEGV